MTIILTNKKITEQKSISSTFEVIINSKRIHCYKWLKTDSENPNLNESDYGIANKDDEGMLDEEEYDEIMDFLVDMDYEDLGW